MSFGAFYSPDTPEFKGLNDGADSGRYLRSQQISPVPVRRNRGRRDVNGLRKFQ